MTRAELMACLEAAGVGDARPVDSGPHPAIVRVRVGLPSANQELARTTVEALEDVRILHMWYEDKHRFLVLRVELAGEG